MTDKPQCAEIPASEGLEPEVIPFILALIDDRPNIDDVVEVVATGKLAVVKEIYKNFHHVMFHLKFDDGPIVPYRRDEVRLKERAR
ncbi:hypothetical protein [Saccharopolyspora taberi]|uniref:Uncharacterized protein n=1 Tax=Saccharopolyspora taberi TaxID=60895 RepID=A0ABN3VM82_9PSEU